MEEHAGDLEGWVFNIEEVSAGVYQARGVDEAGRSVQMSGTDPDALLERCKKSAAEIAQSIPSSPRSGHGRRP